MSVIFLQTLGGTSGWEGELDMSGKVTAFVAGVLIASLFWIVLAQQSYCAGSLADWLHMGDVEECR